jgi:hypothetical protein
MDVKLRFWQSVSVVLSIVCIFGSVLRIAQLRAPILHSPAERIRLQISSLLFLVLVGLFLKLPTILVEGRKKFTFDWITFLIYGLPSLGLFIFAPCIIPYFQLLLKGFAEYADWYAVHAIASMWLGAALALSIRKKQSSQQ